MLDDPRMAWVYILECSDSTYSIGSTTDLPARLEQHELGLGAAYTRRRRPVRLAWAMEFDSVVDAFAFEKQTQNWSRAKRQALIDGRFEDLPGLARGRTGYMSRGVTPRPNPPGLD
jgi:predicted GIY-YIG superfamily endonuclease